MPILPIIKYPNPILRKKAEKVNDPLDPEIQKLIPRMIETLRKSNGLGLAAPQVKKTIRLCVIEEGGVLYTLINPKIKSQSKNKIIMDEGCLSFPGKFFLIARPEKVKIRYTDGKGENRKLKAEGLLARTIQHEIDHLDGILLTDRSKIKKTKKL
ncbi:MAG: peptide deformylase [Candidatus Moranbacteria bacterium RIFCSPHIGHO2_02_FULL_40_12b]|nr:MAG: peptide deformylase [Candidatus Moranbacteria bacterium RIFCSPHIGHO2_02_FULL_40_12b]OGI23488.1 MAG: peptide deformylase [Candidatus Moranbacteria bacterium RIFCSPHIGHO2_12_FULL_40_10]